MIYTVTFNPSLDYIVTVKNFTCGAINRTSDEKIFAGGKGINVSMVLKNLGQKTTALGFLAGFTGNRIEQLLEKKEIWTDFIKADQGMSRINVKLRSLKETLKQEINFEQEEAAAREKRYTQEETEINGQGPFITKAEIAELYKKLDALKAGDILVLAGSIPSMMPSTIYMDIMEYLQGRQIKIAVDASGDLLKKVLPYQPFLIKPNNHELGGLFGVTLTEKEEVIHYAKKLKELGAANVLVSMAGAGAVLVAEDGKVYQAKAPKGVVKNSVGAGDSMVAGFLAGYMETGSYKEAFKMGICAGSASAFSEELASKEEVLALYESISE